MRLLILAAALAVPMSSTASPPPALAPGILLPESAAPLGPLSARNCPDRSGIVTTGRGKPARAKRLGDLPSANLSLAVVREFNGCPESTVVRYGNGEGALLPAER